MKVQFLLKMKQHYVYIMIQPSLVHKVMNASLAAVLISMVYFLHRIASLKATALRKILVVIALMTLNAHLLLALREYAHLSYSKR